MSNERIKFESIALAVTYDDDLHGEMTGIFLPWPDAKKLDGTICQVRSTHWTRWDFIKAWFIKRKLDKLMKDC